MKGTEQGLYNSPKINNPNKMLQVMRKTFMVCKQLGQGANTPCFLIDIQTSTMLYFKEPRCIRNLITCPIQGTRTQLKGCEPKTFCIKYCA